MSINKFQERVFRTGCGTAVLYCCAAVFFGGMFYLGCGTGARLSNQNEPGEQKVAVTVGDYPIYANDLSKQIEARRQEAFQQGQQGGPDALPPREEAFLQGNVVNQVVQNVGFAYLAKKDGVAFTDAAIKKAESDNFDQSIMMAKMQLGQQMNIRTQLTDKQFDDLLKKRTGKTLAEQRKAFNDNLDKSLKDSKERATLESTVARSVLLDALQTRVKPTDAELKASYDSYVFKRILFGADAGGDVNAQIQKAQADLKGGLAFEMAMDRYSKDPAMKGKKPSDNTAEMGVSQIDGTPAFAPLKSLKPGAVSDVIDTPTGKAIYKLINVHNTAPTDLLTKKATYLQQYASQKANEQLDKESKDLMKSGVIKWQAPGFKVLFDWMQASNDFAAGPAGQVAKMTEIVGAAKAALSKNQGYDQRAALLTWFAAEDSVWTAPGADKKKLAADRIEVIKAVTADTPYFSLKMELVDLLVDAKQGPEAAAVLVDAAASNVFYDAVGQRDFQDVNAKLAKLKDAKAVTPAQEAAIIKSQDDWVKQNQMVEEQKAQAKAAQEAAKKEADALKAKQLSEAAKAKADAAKGAKPGTTPPATTGTDKPATGAAPVKK